MVYFPVLRICIIWNGSRSMILKKDFETDPDPGKKRIQYRKQEDVQHFIKTVISKALG